MKLTVVENQFKKFAAILGVIQGLAYLILALICIVLYNKDPPNLEINTYWGRVNYEMFYLFLGHDFRGFPNQTLYPKTFTVFAWIYFLLHLMWIGVSVGVTGDKGVRTPKYMTAWSHCTLLISVWDLITVIILGADYNKCLSYASEFNGDEVCATGILPVLVIAARGFVLWIINVGLALILNKMARRLKKDALAVHQNLSAPIGHPETQIPVQSPTLYPQSTPYIAPSPQTSNRHIFENSAYRSSAPYPQPTSYTPPSSQTSNSHPFENPAYRSPTHIQSPNKNRIQFDYPIHRPEASPHAQSSPKNPNRNQNEFPVHIPDPDYHLNQQQTAYRRSPI